MSVLFTVVRLLWSFNHRAGVFNLGCGYPKDLQDLFKRYMDIKYLTNTHHFVWNGRCGVWTELHITNKTS